jgi:hypothetical protein
MAGRRSLEGVIGRHFASFRKSQRTTMTALCDGLAAARRLGLASIARGMAGLTTVRHRIKRVDRFCSNRGISAQKATVCLVAWLASVTRRTAVIALDWTDIGAGRVMLSAAVALSRRALPVAWTIMGKSQFDRKRKSRNDAEDQMILRLQEAFGQHPWVLVADRGFARADLFAKLKDWKIDFVIRACGNPWVEMDGWAGRLWDLPRQAGQRRRYRNVFYHKARRVAVNLVVAHKEPAPEPWYLVTNIEDAAQAAHAYRQRAWIEEHFRDAKSNMGLDKLRVTKAKRIERLMILLAVVMMTVVLVALDWKQKHGDKDPQLSTHKRGVNVLSMFRLGLELLRLDGLPTGFARLRLTLAPEAL